jgi:hypothetical protein
MLMNGVQPFYDRNQLRSLKEINREYFIGHMIVVSELPGPHRASANVSNLPAYKEVMESLHSLFGSRIVEISPMDLEEVDVRSVEPLQRRLDLIEDCRTSESTLIDVVPCIPQIGYGIAVLIDLVVRQTVALGQDDEQMTRDTELNAQEL